MLGTIEIAAALVSIASALFAIFAWFASRREARAADDSARRARDEAAAIAREANDWAAMRWSAQHFQGLRTWASDATVAMCEAQELLSAKEHAEAERRRIRAVLSAALDAGRWYFPNTFEERFGTSNPPAYRGLRPPVLDCLYEVYQALEAPSAGRSSHEVVIRAKRAFVSHIQAELDPRRINDRIDALKARYGDLDRMQ